MNETTLNATVQIKSENKYRLTEQLNQIFQEVVNNITNSQLKVEDDLTKNKNTYNDKEITKFQK